MDWQYSLKTECENMRDYSVEHCQSHKTLLYMNLKNVMLILP